MHSNGNENANENDGAGTTTNETTSHRVEEIARSLQQHDGRSDQIARAAARLATTGLSQTIACKTASVALDAIAESLDSTAAFGDGVKRVWPSEVPIKEKLRRLG